LRPDGTLWLNLGDTYAANRNFQVPDGKYKDVGNYRGMKVPDGLKQKDLVGIPWRTALALQDAGWYLRSDIIWSKKNPMPESVTDRPTKAHEYVFLLTKKPQYFYDAFAVRENPAEYIRKGGTGVYLADGATTHGVGSQTFHQMNPMGRNRRSVWTIPTQSYTGAHFATWPPQLVELMIKAGSSEKGCCAACGAPWERAGDIWRPTCQCSSKVVNRSVVMDIFSGSATTGMVALQNGRNYIGIDANPDYLDLAKARILGQMAPQKTSKPESDSVFDLF